MKTSSGFTSEVVTTEIGPGESVALVGRSGSGKTLILEQLAGVLRPGVDQIGTVTGSRVTWVPQDARLSVLPTDRVWSLVGLSGIGVRLKQLTGRRPPLSVDENRAIDLMNRLRLDADRIAELPFRALSVTERRCVLLVRALLQEPPILAIDGWDEQMDGPSRRAIATLLKEHTSKGSSLILTSRRHPLADFGEARTVVLGELEGAAESPVPLLRKPERAPPHEHPLLEVTRLSVGRRRLNVIVRRPPALVIDGASLFVRHGECLALLGIAGSGKTTLLQAISGLTPATRGSIRVEGNDVTQARGRRARRLRKDVQLVFQDASSVLDGYRSVGAHLEEAMALRGGNRGSPSEWLERLGLSPRLLKAPADQLSAAEGQRIDLARSLIVSPKLVLFDAPEVAGAAEDGGLLASLIHAEKTRGRAFLVATSNPELARGLGDRVAILHAGRIVELGGREEVLSHPGHPLTQALLEGGEIGANDPTAPAPGCPYVLQCPRRKLPQCDEQEPMLAPMRTLRDLDADAESGGRRVACFHPIVD